MSASRTIRCVCIAASIFAAAPTASAQSAWKPGRAVEIVTGTTGGGADRMARLTQSLMQEKNLLPVPAAVIPKPGAGNSIAFSYMSQKSGDAHYLLVTTLSLSVNHLTGTSRLGYRDFTPLCTLFDEYVALVVRANSTIGNGRELVERLRKDPTSVSIGITSVGGANHLAAAIVLKAAGVDVKKIRTVAFESAGKAVLAVLGGHVDVAPVSASVPVPHLAAGTVRVLGITAPRRLAAIYAEVPTWREQGVNAEFSSYRGYTLPRDTTDAPVAFWERIFATIDQDPRWHEEAEKNLLHRQFRASRATRQYLADLEAPLKAALADLDMLR